MHAPPRSPAPLLLSLLGIACTTVESPIDATLPDEGLHRVVLDVDQGDLAYSPGPAGALQLEGRAWGRASDPEDAAARLDAVEFHAVRDGDAAIARGRTSGWGAGADITARGPADLDVTLDTRSGTARLAHVSGMQVVRADRVELEHVEGSVDIDASGPVDAHLLLRHGDRVRVNAEGDVRLLLPPGLDYDLQIWGDPEHVLEMADLGFEAAYGDQGYFAGVAGPGTTRVDVMVTGGSVQILPHGRW